MIRKIIIILLPLLLCISCEKGSEEQYSVRFYGDTYEDVGHSISIGDDGYYITGQVTEIYRRDVDYILSSDKNMGIIKTGWDGNVIWKVSAGGKFDDLGSKICCLSDGSVICTGTFTDTTTSVPLQTDIFALRVSAEGNIIWQRKYGGPGNQAGKDIIEIPDGFLILGSTDEERPPSSDSTGNRAGKKDIYLVRINGNGDLIESFAYGYPGNDVGTVLKKDSGNNYIVLGTTDRSDPGQSGNNIIIVRLNTAGNAIESKIIGGTSDEYAADIEVLTDGYFISGTVGKVGEDQAIFMTRLSANIFADPFPGFPKQVSVNGLSSGANATSSYQNGSFIIAGYSGKDKASDMLIFEVDSEGNQVAGRQIIKGSTGEQIAYDVASGEDGYIIAVGKNGYEANSMISFLKFRF